MSITKLLGGLLSDKVKRPIIVNGKLFTTPKGQIVYVKMGAGYRVNFFTSTSRNLDAEDILEDGEELLGKMIEEFNEKYKVFATDKVTLLEFNANIDSFTKAVVLHSGLYDVLLDIDDVNHLHDGTRQFREDMQTKLAEFLTDSFINYFEVYVLLLNKRLMGGHLPIIVKGHLVAGLYQPLVVQTRYIRSPLKFGEFKWFFDYLNSPEDCEEYLERVMQTSRSLDLSVISISDLQAKFGVPNIRELKRVHWLFILMLVLIRRYSSDGRKRFVARYQRLYNLMAEGDPAFTPGGFAFFLSLYKGVEQISTRLAIR